MHDGEIEMCRGKIKDSGGKRKAQKLMRKIKG